jgi:hypothetical protein
MEKDREKTLADIQAEFEYQRTRWRSVREERLKLKRELEARGLDKSSVRRDLEHKRLRKEQDRLSTIIKHIEKRLSRKRANLGKQENKP